MPVVKPDRQPAELRILGLVRDARFPRGPACVRCACPDVIRWGQFSGRQRYRCRHCARTFSDLTATPMAYTKRLADWPAHLSLMRRCATLRATAALLDLHISTAFRWRHATLRSLCMQRPTLNGIVEMRELMFPYSDKGSRSGAVARRRGARSEMKVWVVTRREFCALFRARDGTARSLSFEHGVMLPHEVAAFVRESFGPKCTLLTDQPRGATYGRIARAQGHAAIRVNRALERSILYHTEHIGAYVQELKKWFVRFRGIASVYRARYLAWHRLLSEFESWPLLERCVSVSDAPRIPP